MTSDYSSLHACLEQLVTSYDIRKDPYIVELVTNSNNYHNVARKIEEAYINGNTYCLKELKSLVAKYEATANELGPCVADWCLQQCIAQFRKLVSLL